MIHKIIKPMFNRVVTTSEEYSEDEAKLSNGMIDPTKLTKGLKEFQKVIAVGCAVKDVKEGDVICIDYTRYAKLTHSKDSIRETMEKDNPVVSYLVPKVELNGQRCLMIYDNDIVYKVVE